MKKLFAILIALVFVLMLAACDGNETQTSQSSKAPSSTTSSSGGGTADSTPSSGKPDDTTQSSNTNPNPKPDDGGNGGNTEPDNEFVRPTVNEVLSEVLKVFDAQDTFGNEGISSYAGYTDCDISAYEGGKQLSIKKGGIYRIYGKTSNGQIYIEAKDQKVILLLDGADISYSGTYAPIYAENCSEVIIILAEGSVNRVADIKGNKDSSPIRVRSCDLTLDGKGELIVDGNAKHGISCTKNIIINGGKYDITSESHGVYGKLGLTVNGGKFKIDSEKSGFKSGDDGNGDPNEIAEGKIVINACSAEIDSETNAINSYGSVEINNGRINTKSRGNAIQATKDITINGGTMYFNNTNNVDDVNVDVHEAIKNTIKGDQNVSILGTANVRILTNGIGIRCDGNLTIETTGVLYIKTLPVFTETIDGDYKLKGGEYVPVDGTESGVTRKYSLVECKGIEVKKNVTISKATVGIDSFEDCINANAVVINGAKLVVATKKDAIDSSTDITVNGASDINVLESDKGLKAAGKEGLTEINKVSLNSGNVTICAKTDAIKAHSVTIVTGKHILFDKIECETNIAVRGGTLVCISTTEKPVDIKATIANAQGTIIHKSLCTAGKIITVKIGSKFETVTLPKDFSEKISVVYATDAEGDGSVIIGDNEKQESLTKGNVYN